MRKLKFFTHCTLLATTPTLLAYPQNNLPRVTAAVMNYGYQQETQEWVRPTTYDEIMQMLEDLESGELERRYPPEQLERVNEYLATLANEGILPNEFDEEADLEEDAYDLLYGEDSGFQLARYLESSSEYMIIPAVLNGYSGYNIVQCGKISHAWKKTKKFAKKHKKAIIIGAVVVVAVAAVTVAVVVVSSAAAASAASTAAGAAGAAGAAASGSSKSESSGSSSSASSGSQTSSNDVSTFQAAMEDQVSSFKEHLAGENFFQPSEAGQGLSIEETGRVVGSLFAHDSFNHFNNQISDYPQLSQEMQSISSHYDFPLPSGASDNPVGSGHNEIDWRFSSNCGSVFSDPAKEVNFNALSYQMRGEAASFYGYHNQAISDFSKAIDMNPTDPMLFLQRGISHLNTEQYERSIADFQSYVTQAEQTPQKEQFNLAEFTIGFAEGLPQGIYKGGKETLLFATGCVSHPIHTAKQIYEACSILAKYVHTNEWEIIGKALSPELHKVITEWDYTPSRERGKLIALSVGEFGAQVVIPGAGAKIIAKGIKGAQEVTCVLKNIGRVEEMILLEAAAEVGNGAKFGEILNAGRRTGFLGEELGFTAKEMGQLKQAGKLETTLQKELNHLSLPKQESTKLFVEAENFLSGHKGYIPEHKVRGLIHETGIPTFARPKGIPENYRVKLSKNGAGMKYVHPNNEQTYVRVMPGKPHSKHATQQKPYVIQMKYGNTLDKHGNIVNKRAPEAHIPLEEFIYRN
ncbi:MAG: hypothetical protein K1000chlam2_00897 [Chlamydiae bacterium]|nr:hypothetical protein [Chlamydiota bacterium]